MNNALKKLGRRKAGSWGRPKKNKRAASKAARRAGRKEIG